ncbi:MAG: HEAT repeat domain-containing protein [Anaerolineaceae bacterium]|nr:HEAT repeat domain-containing protein [Anaerolineaceae bacterium]
MPLLKEFINKQIQASNRRNLSGIENALRQETLKRAQSMHLARSLFSLDEIIIPPRLIAPPPLIEPDSPPPNETIANQIIPYLPDWPEFSAQYSLTSLTLSQALLNNVHLAIIGQPGCGKTVALAYLASIVARHDPEAEQLADYFPILLHILDLNLDLTQNPLDNLINAVSGQAGLLQQNRVPGLIRSIEKLGKILLLLDGVDELGPESIPPICEYLKSLTSKYPNILLVTTASPDYIDGLGDVGIYPMALAAWNFHERNQFIEKWGSLWTAELAPEITKQVSLDAVDTGLILNWLASDNSVLSSLEWTLKVWAIYAGDLSGPSSIRALEAYFLRLTKGTIPASALGNVAIQMFEKNQSTMGYGEIEKILTKFHPGGVEVVDETAEQNQNLPTNLKRNQKERKISSGDRALSVLLENGIVIEHASEQIRFVNPQIFGYLAGLAADTDWKFDLNKNGYWSAKLQTLRYLSSQNKANSWINEFIELDEAPLFRNLLICCRWLSEVAPNTNWRTKVLRKLVDLINDEKLPAGVHARIFAGLFSTSDSSLSLLYKQLLTSNSPVSRRFAALSCGAARDIKSMRDLIGLLNDQISEVRHAACLALAAVGDIPSIEAVAKALLHGDESLRLAAAEALANKPPDGDDMLKEAIEMNDLMVRRAAVFGLSQINKKWASELLEKVSVQDGQWIVRNAAAQAMESASRPNPYIPHYLPEPSSSSWLISFASKQGSGVSPNQSATGILLKALEIGKIDEQIAAINYLRQTQDEAVMASLCKIVSEAQSPLQDYCLYAIWYMSICGVKLPVPVAN